MPSVMNPDLNHASLVSTFGLEKDDSIAWNGELMPIRETTGTIRILLIPKLPKA